MPELRLSDQLALENPVGPENEAYMRRLILERALAQERARRAPSPEVGVEMGPARVVERQPTRAAIARRNRKRMARREARAERNVNKLIKSLYSKLERVSRVSPGSGEPGESEYFAGYTLPEGAVSIARLPKAFREALGQDYPGFYLPMDKLNRKERWMARLLLRAGEIEEREMQRAQASQP